MDDSSAGFRYTYVMLKVKEFHYIGDTFRYQKRIFKNLGARPS